MRYLPVTIQGKIAEYMSSEKMICYNSDYILQFTFDAEWDSYNQKTAQIRYFSTNKGWVKHDIIFTGLECNVPVIPNASVVYVGVYAGDIKTTTEAEITCRPSVLSYDGAPANPPDDVYNQIMQKLNELEQSGVSPEQIAAAVEQYITENPITAADVNAVPQNQGAENAGKFMGVNESGEVVPVDAPSGGSGTDIALGITGAAVGQIARITAVDDAGMPTAWEAVESEEIYESLFEVTEAVDSVEYDFLDENNNYVILKEIEIIQHFLSTNKSGADTNIKVLLADGSIKYILVANNYANAAGNWVCTASFASVLGCTIRCYTNKSIGASGIYSGGFVNQGVVYPAKGWGDRWAADSTKPVGIIGIKIPGAVGALSQFYVAGVRA